MAALPARADVNPLERRAASETRKGLQRIACETAGRGRRQAKPQTLADLCCIVGRALSRKRRRIGRHLKPAERARLGGGQDAAIIGLAFYGALRLPGISPMRFKHIHEASAGEPRILAPTSKANQDGSTPDRRYVKDGTSAFLRFLRDAYGAGPATRVTPLTRHSINNCIRKATVQAGVEGITSHSGRRGIATELARHKATTVQIKQAVSWRTDRIVSYYASAVRAEEGAVAKLL